ncbi:hypothetical protein AB4865_11570 [Capnocytophaga sp. ARDL2]|uniref:hypothetical protein n=1 Tax=Capnocytophaga sp. ARDL2 TaxID=3238809 RepID=UPI0035586677
MEEEVKNYLIEPHLKNEKDLSYSIRMNKNTRVRDEFLNGFVGRGRYTKIHFHTHPNDDDPSSQDRERARHKIIPHYVFGKTLNFLYNQYGVEKRYKRN